MNTTRTVRSKNVVKSNKNRHKFKFNNKQKKGGKNDWIQGHCQVLFNKRV
jgi:hypothetical protein